MTSPGNIPNSLLFLTESDYYVHKIKGKKIKFSPLSVKVLFGCRPLLQPLSALMAVLFLERAPENSVLTERMTDLPPDSNTELGMVSTDKTTVSAIDPGLYSEKHDRVQTATDRALETLLSPSAQKFLAGLILQSCGDSLDDLLTDDEAMPEALSFLLALPVPVFLDFAYGLYKANEGALGKLLDGLQASRAGKTSNTSSSPSPKPVTKE